MLALSLLYGCVRAFCLCLVFFDDFFVYVLRGNNEKIQAETNEKQKPERFRRKEGEAAEFVCVCVEEDPAKDECCVRCDR